GLEWPLPRQRRGPAAHPARGPVAGTLGQTGGRAPRGPLLLLPAKPHTARPRCDPHTRQPGRPPRHGRQPAADTAGAGGRPPGSERRAAPALCNSTGALGGAFPPRRGGLGPLVRPANAWIRPVAVAAGTARAGAAVRLRPAGGLDRNAARPPRPPG